MTAPRAGSTNWGRNARKNSAVFGFSTFTTKPCRKPRHRSDRSAVDPSSRAATRRLVGMLGREVGAHNGIVIIDWRAADHPRQLRFCALLAAASAPKRKQELRAVGFDRAGQVAGRMIC